MRVFIFILSLFPVFGSAQKHDHVWLFGYSFVDNPHDSIWGTSVIDFNKTPPNVYYDGNKKLDFLGSGLCISDNEGNFLFSSDGEWIENHANLPIENDDILNYFEPITTPQSNIALPLNDRPGQYLFLHVTLDFFPVLLGGKELLYSIIDMNENGGLGKVTTLNQIIFSDTMSVGKLTATRHANGKDWWIVNRKMNSNKYFITLFDGENFEVNSQIIGDKTFSGYGQACFSPDGSKYVNASSISAEEGRYFDLYDFDRCKGELNNHIQIHSDRPGISGGVAFSPNSRFLYVGSYDKIFQYDTWADDVVDSETLVAEFDGYLDTLESSNGSVFISYTHFMFMQLAPDGKIYINTPASTRVLHRIEKPDKKGLSCEVNQHAIDLPTSNLTMVSFPNYRLGALKGSPCDSITTSTNSLVEDLKIAVYPNPAQDKIEIEFQNPLTVSGNFILYRLTGKKLKSFELIKGQQETHLELTSMPPGLYFYKIEVNHISIDTGKLVIE